MERKKFKLFGSTWTMKEVDSAKNPDGEWAFGTANAYTKILEISTKNPEGKNLSKEEIRLTKIHELVHAIFETGQYLQSNLDEPLVEWVARCLITLIDQGMLKL